MVRFVDFCRDLQWHAATLGDADGAIFDIGMTPRLTQSFDTKGIALIALGQRHNRFGQGQFRCKQECRPVNAVEAAYLFAEAGRLRSGSCIYRGL